MDWYKEMSQKTRVFWFYGALSSKFALRLLFAIPPSLSSIDQDKLDQFHLYVSIAIPSVQACGSSKLDDMGGI